MPEDRRWKGRREDAESWKGRALIRRDFRHTHDGPEVARGRRSGRRGRDRSGRWCRGVRGRDHVLEQFVTSTWTQTLADGSEVVHDRLGWRCARCKRTDWKLFGPEARRRIDAEFARGLGLAERWCGGGHLFAAPDRAPEEFPDRWRLWWRPREVCVMCGLVRGSRPQRFVPVRPPAGR